MKLRLLFAAMILPACALAQDGFSPERLERARQTMTGMIERREYPGVNALIARHGEVVFSASLGFQDVEAGVPMKPDTIFLVASLTKPVTAAAVMMLYEEGHFLLDEPVSKYLPAYANLQVLATEGGDQDKVVPATTPLTIRHLLTHTSGLFNFKGNVAAGITIKLTLAETVDKLATVPLAHQPGAAWRYGLSYEVLARLVELWSGKPFDVFVMERIFQPLAMKDTAFYVPAEKASRLAKGYRLNEKNQVEVLPRQGAPAQPPVMISGGGGLFSTAGDYLRFCQMLLNGGELDGHRLLGPVTLDYMFQNHVPAPVMTPDGPNGRKGFSQGFGGYVLVDPSAYEDVSVKGEYNAAGSGGTFFWIDREHDLIGIWFAQRYPQVQSTLKRFKVLTYQALEK